MMNYGSGRNKRRHAGKWSVKARSKGVGTPYLDRDAMLGPLGQKTPKKLNEKNLLSQRFKAERQIPRHLVG
jgi:hypothetical protein